MKVILSPAKSLNENPEYQIQPTQPVFQEESENLVKKLSKLSAKKIEKLMDVSTDIAELNYERFQNWSLPFTEKNSKPAAYMFSGAAYQGMDYASMSKKEQERGQDILRILSGLYGLLRPFDLIQPYRLEMGTKFAVTPKVKNLYMFWGDKIRKELEEELARDPNPALVNLASNEYAKAAQLTKLDYEVITPVFKDMNKKGEFKVNMQFAKLSRGRMTRFIIQNDIKDIESLKAFDAEGYRFSPNDSTETEFVFLRG